MAITPKQLLVAKIDIEEKKLRDAIMAAEEEIDAALMENYDKADTTFEFPTQGLDEKVVSAIRVRYEEAGWSIDAPKDIDGKLIFKIQDPDKLAAELASEGMDMPESEK